MRLYGYGEEALTLCALARNLDDILQALADRSRPPACQVFWHPSFGRRGGERRSEFGAFAFILLTRHNLYLGESRWDKLSQEIKDGVLKLGPDETLRHETFKFYVKNWAFGDYQHWDELREKAQPLIAKHIPGKETRLASNLKTVLAVIKEHFASEPAIKDVLLYFHDRDSQQPLPLQVGDGFELVCIDCTSAKRGNYVEIVM
jgi:hypothetical protein